MIDIRICYHGDQRITGITVSGHAGYERCGKDIVCAGVSALAIGVANGLQRHRGKLVSVNISEDRLSIETDKDVVDEVLSVLLQTLADGLEQIQDNYPKSVRIEYVHAEGNSYD